MTAAHSFPWPGSRVLAGWWPLLERWRPRAVWLHHLLLHHIDAHVTVSQSPALDNLNRLLLESLESGPDVAALAATLALDVPLLTRLLVDLKSAGFVLKHEERWTLTDVGQRALAAQHPICTQQERRTFYFTQGDERHPGARFLPLDRPSSVPSLDHEGWHFDLQALHDCLGRDAAWKQAHGFPTDVRSLAKGGEVWQRIVLDRGEQLSLVCLQTEEQDRLLGFSVQTSSWQLHGERAVLALGSNWRESLPELTDQLTVEEWRQAWRAWGQPRGLPAGEIEACHLEQHGVRLRVQAPRPLIERLRSARSDALKGEAWLLA